jgi:hypothetical protein
LGKSAGGEASAAFCTVVGDLIALGTLAALLICAIALGHLLRRLSTGALILPGRGEAWSMLPLPSADQPSDCDPNTFPDEEPSNLGSVVDRRAAGAAQPGDRGSAGDRE